MKKPRKTTIIFGIALLIFLGFSALMLITFIYTRPLYISAVHESTMPEWKIIAFRVPEDSILIPIAEHLMCYNLTALALVSILAIFFGGHFTSRLIEKKR